MSYCVQCGVELAPSESQCPLCGVIVQNPRQPYNEKAPKPYPDKPDREQERLSRRFIGGLITIMIALPVALSLLIDWRLNGTFSWSLYVAGALGLIWLAVVPFGLWVQPTYVRIALSVFIGTAFYLYLIARLNHADWYWSLALPITVLCATAFLSIGLLIQFAVLRGFLAAGGILTAVGLLAVGIEQVLAWNRLGRTEWRWSLFVLIPCLALAAVSVLAQQRRSWREALYRRLHV